MNVFFILLMTYSCSAASGVCTSAKAYSNLYQCQTAGEAMNAKVLWRCTPLSVFLNNGVVTVAVD